MHSQIASDDSVLQIITRSALKDLLCFVDCPTKENASSLALIPALYNVLRYEEKRAKMYPPDLLGMCRWLVERTNGVLMTLSIHAVPDIDEDINPADKDWRQVSLISYHDKNELALNRPGTRLAVAIACHR